jgi:hypothetical protein
MLQVDLSALSIAQGTVSEVTKMNAGAVLTLLMTKKQDEMKREASKSFIAKDSICKKREKKNIEVRCKCVTRIFFLGGE